MSSDALARMMLRVEATQAIKCLVLRHGIVQSWPRIKAQFVSCSEAYVILMANEQNSTHNKDRDTEYSDCPVFPEGYCDSTNVCFNTCFLGQLLALPCFFF